MLVRPTDDKLRRFAWTKDAGSVQRLFEGVQQHLTSLGTRWQNALPFPATREELGTFSENGWRKWILSVTAGDKDGVEALARFSSTCAMRLGETLQSADDLLQRLVDVPQERLDVELKPWLVPSDPSGIAKIAKACLALRNNDGGYLVVGFEDDGTPSPDPPKNVAEFYHVDKIQEIASKYASEPFAVTVELRERQGLAYPIIVVPDGLITPVFSKSDLFDPNDTTKRWIEDDTIYVRSITANNRVSSSRIRRSDISRLTKICFDNREADIGAFIRRHLAGLTPEVLKTALAAVRQSVEPAITPAMILEQGYERFQTAAKEAGQDLPDVGYWESAAVVNGLESIYTASQELLHRLQLIRHHHSGWPPWTIIENPNNASMNPHVVNGMWEALMVSNNDPVLDYWQIHPEGRFYCVRALEDDMQQQSRGPRPRSTLDFSLAVYRVTETISTVLQFSRELGATSENTIDFVFKWRGLRNRILGSWSEPGRMLRRNASAYDDEVNATVELTADVPASAIPSYVHRVVRKLFLAFDGYELPQQTIEEIASDVLKRRM